MSYEGPARDAFALRGAYFERSPEFITRQFLDEASFVAPARRPHTRVRPANRNIDRHSMKDTHLPEEPWN